MLEKKIFEESVGPSQEDEDPSLPESVHSSCNNGEKLSSSSSTASHNSFQHTRKSTAAAKSQDEGYAFLETGPSGSSRHRRSSPLNTSSEDVIEEEPSDHHFRPISRAAPDSEQAYDYYFLDQQDISHDDRLNYPLPANDIPIIPVMVMSPSDIDSVFEDNNKFQSQSFNARSNKKKSKTAYRKPFKSSEIDGVDEEPSSPPPLPNHICPSPIPVVHSRRRHHSYAGPLPSNPISKVRKASEHYPAPECNHRQLNLSSSNDPMSSIPASGDLKHEMLFNLELTPHKDLPLNNLEPGTGMVCIEMLPLSEDHLTVNSDCDIIETDPKDDMMNCKEKVESGQIPLECPVALELEHPNENLASLPPGSVLSGSSNEQQSLKNNFRSSTSFTADIRESEDKVMLVSPESKLSCCEPSQGDIHRSQDAKNELSGEGLKEVEYDTVWVAPDGGWGWWVLFGSIVVNILIPGTVKSFGVLFIEFIEAFDTSPSAAAWIPALSYWLYSSTGPFASALSARYSFRTVTILGGLLASAGLCLSYFATSITFLYISYGVIGGLGAGLAYPIGVFIIGRYFDKRRGLANGLCTSGSALGSVLVPPLLRLLLEQYGYRQAILYMGLILLNVCLAALFYDPVDKHLKKILVPRDDSMQGQVETTEEPVFGRGPASKLVEIGGNNLGSRHGSHGCREVAASMPIAIPAPHFEQRDVRDRRGSGSIRRATFQIGHETPQGESWSLRSNDGASPLAARLLNEESSRLGSSPRTSFTHRPRPNPYSFESNPDSETLFTGSHLISSTGAISAVQSATASRSRLNLTAIPEDEDYTPSESGSRNMDWNYYNELPAAKQRLLRLSMNNGSQLLAPRSSANLSQQGHTTSGSGLARTLSMASNVSTSSFHYVSTIHHGSLLMQMQYDKTLPDFASTLTLKSVGDSCWKCWWNFPRNCLQRCGLGGKDKTQDTTDQSGKAASRRRPDSGNIFDFNLLKDGFFIIMLISTCTTAVGYTNFIIMLPSYAIKMGFQKSESSLLLSVVAALDFVGRIGGAGLSDLRFIQRKWFFIVGLLMSGVALALLPLATTYSSLVIFCACFGLASGTYIGVTAVILADQLGPEKLGQSYGITLFVNGMLQLAGPPICGLLYEKLGRYEPILIGLGFTLIFGASMWLFTPFIERRRQNLADRQNENFVAVEVAPLLTDIVPSLGNTDKSRSAKLEDVIVLPKTKNADSSLV